MAWVKKMFRKRDVAVLVTGVVIVQLLAFLLINRFMFHPVKGGYDRTMDGYVDIGTNGVAVAARVIGPAKGKKVIMYCHGNAEDMTAIDGRFDALVDDGYTIATFDYPGYGLSDGSPDEEGCYRNAHRLYDWLVHERGFAAKDVVVVGFSIGTGVATELAASREVGGLWLEAPYLSAPRVVTRIRMLLVDPFPNCDRIQAVKCPIVMLHGTADSVIPYSQGRTLYDLAPQPKRFIPVEGAGHTDFIDALGRKRYQEMLLSFVRDLSGREAGDAGIRARGVEAGRCGLRSSIPPPRRRGRRSRCPAVRCRTGQRSARGCRQQSFQSSFSFSSLLTWCIDDERTPI